MQDVLDLNESTQELGRLALRVAANIDKFQRKKIESLPELDDFRTQLVKLTGLQGSDRDVSFSGEVTAVNLVGAALTGIFNNQKNIDDLAQQLSNLVKHISATPQASDTVLRQLQKFCLSLNQEIVRARYNSTLEDDYSESERERRLA